MSDLDPTELTEIKGNSIMTIQCLLFMLTGSFFLNTVCLCKGTLLMKTHHVFSFHCKILSYLYHWVCHYIQSLFNWFYASLKANKQANLAFEFGYTEHKWSLYMRIGQFLLVTKLLFKK